MSTANRRSTPDLDIKTRNPSMTIEFDCPTLALSFRAKADDDNPELVEKVFATLPFESVVGHVVVSGGGIWVPTRIVHVGHSRMVERHLGTVYFYAPGQTICITYGSITESAFVNRFAVVPPEDLMTLVKVGEQVYLRTVTNAQREAVPVLIKPGRDGA